MRKLKLVTSLVALFCLLSACLSQIPGLREWADQCIGLPVSELQAMEAEPESYASRVGWKTRTYELPNGNWVHVAPDRKDCEVHFEVDKAGIMIAYQLVGEGCRYQ